MKTKSMFIQFASDTKLWSVSYYNEWQKQYSKRLHEVKKMVQD